jgi:hypothetical protein
VILETAPDIEAGQAVVPSYDGGFGARRSV